MGFFATTLAGHVFSLNATKVQVTFDDGSFTVFDTKDESFSQSTKEQSCIQGDYCNGITNEATCCFECDKLEECTEDGCTCDNESCEKYPKGKSAADISLPCDRIEELEDELMDVKDYADALEEENEVLLQELLISKDTIIELQRELLDKPKIW